MSIDGIAALLFVLLLGVFLYSKRRQVQIQRVLFPIIYVIMYRSSFGLRYMDYIAKKFPRIVRLAGDVAIFVGFLGMLFISYELVQNTFQIFIGKGVPGIQPVLPIEAKGVFFVPFLYWILSIFLLALVHEFSHGVIARAHNMPVKSSGFAFLSFLLPVIPAAFVEPDEKVVQKRPYRQQLGLFAAGSFSNLLFALAMFGLFFAISPVLSASFESQGIELVSVSENYAGFAGGLRPGDILLTANNVSLVSPQNITDMLKGLSPGDVLFFDASNRSFEVVLGAHPENASLPYLGIQAKSYFVPKPDFVASYGAWLPPVIKWVSGLIFWLFMLNMGIGFFNLLPIGPLDGGRMFQLVCFKFFKDKSKAIRIWTYVSIFFVIVILTNLLAGFFH